MLSASTILAISGAAFAAGAILVAMMGGTGSSYSAPPMYYVAGQGPVQTQYTPQYPVQQQTPPVYQLPMAQPTQPQIPAQTMPPVQSAPPVYQQQQPTYVEPYQSAYPWGYNAYIATIANTPMAPVNYMPGYQDMVYTPSFGSPQVYTYNFDYKRGGLTSNQPSIWPSPPGAPPGYVSQQYMPPINQCRYNIDLSNVAYTRTYPNGAVSFGKIPICYSDDGSWRGYP